MPFAANSTVTVLCNTVCYTTINVVCVCCAVGTATVCSITSGRCLLQQPLLGCYVRVTVCVTVCCATEEG